MDMNELNMVGKCQMLIVNLSHNYNSTNYFMQACKNELMATGFILGTPVFAIFKTLIIS